LPWSGVLTLTLGLSISSRVLPEHRSNLLARIHPPPKLVVLAAIPKHVKVESCRGHSEPHNGVDKTLPCGSGGRRRGALDQRRSVGVGVGGEAAELTLAEAVDRAKEVSHGL